MIRRALAVVAVGDARMYWLRTLECSWSGDVDEEAEES